MTMIYKYPIQIVLRQQVISMPAGAKILCVQMQPGDHGQLVPCIWAEVDPQQPAHDRVIRVIGTGNPITHRNERTYIGTVQDAPFVWHVFEESY